MSIKRKWFFYFPNFRTSIFGPNLQLWCMSVGKRCTLPSRFNLSLSFPLSPSLSYLFRILIFSLPLNVFKSAGDLKMQKWKIGKTGEMPFPRMERVSSRNLILGSEKPSVGSSKFVLNVACGNSVLTFNSESLFTQTFSNKIFARGLPPGQSWAVWPDCAIYWTLGNFSKPLATINLPKSSTFLGNFWKGVRIYNFPSEIIFGQL